MQTRNRISHTQGRNTETPADIRLRCVRGRAGGEGVVERYVMLRHTIHNDSYFSRHAHWGYQLP